MHVFLILTGYKCSSIEFNKFVIDSILFFFSFFFGQCFQGMDDKVVPPLMTDFVHRVLPGAAVHKLPYEGHFTYFYFCDECHRQIFTTLFGTPQGPLNKNIEVDQTPYEDSVEVDQIEVDHPHEDNVTVQEADQKEEQIDQTPLAEDMQEQEETHTEEEDES